MSCTAIEGIPKDCLNNIGGIYTAWVIDQDDLTGLTVSEANHEVTAITNSVAFEKIEFKRNVGNFTENENNDFANGSKVIEQTVMLKLHRRDAAKSRALKILGEGQRYLAIVVGTAAGKYWLFEYMQIQTTAGGSGEAKADGSNYDVTFFGTAETYAYEVDATLIPDLEQVNS